MMDVYRVEFCQDLLETMPNWQRVIIAAMISNRFDTYANTWRSVHRVSEIGDEEREYLNWLAGDVQRWIDQQFRTDGGIVFVYTGPFE